MLGWRHGNACAANDHVVTVTTDSLEAYRKFSGTCGWSPNQEDLVIIEGYPAMQGSEHVLLAQSCVSMLQQRAQKQARQQPQAETTS